MEQNKIAYSISKIHCTDSWGVWDKFFFQFLDHIWGPHDIDRFADSEKRKLPRYNVFRLSK